MLQIDRMEIDDVGGDPCKLAAAIVKQLPDLGGSIPVRKIAAAIDIYEIREEQLSGLEGGLIVPEDKSEGAILVNSERPETRKRYTIAHELGHYVNPWHKSDSPEGFRCRARDLAVERYQPADRATKMEAEANLFAAELLMPPAMVADLLRNSVDADLERILVMAKRFDVSKEAAARRYVAKIDVPAAVIFSKEGIIRYARPNDEFPRLSVRNGHPLPANCLSRTSGSEVGEMSGWSEIPSHAWLEEPNGLTVFEQTLAQRDGFRITLLSIESDDEDDEKTWETPSFA